MSTTEEIGATPATTGRGSAAEYEFGSTRTDAEQGLRVALNMKGARALLESWERVDHRGVPRSAEASANFHLAFLQEQPVASKPHIALWEKDGIPDGILSGRDTLWRPPTSFANIPIPMPRLRLLEIVTDGLEANSRETAQRQASYLRLLLNSRKFDCIAIHNLPLDGEIGRILKLGLRYPGDGRPEVAGHWFTELIDESGQPIVATSSKARRKFRYMDRKLCNFFDNKVKLREFRTPAQVSEFIHAAARIGEKTYQYAMDIGVKDTPIWHKKLGLHAANGHLRAYLLIGNGMPLAYVVGTLWKGTFAGIATGYLPKYRAVSPGSYLLRSVIERLQLEGVRWLDYGIEDYWYKERYGNVHREGATLRFYATTPAARAAIMLDTTIRKTDHTLRRMLQASGLATPLKRVYGHFRRAPAARGR
ncbi:GNAT family N-acetyltransferase [Microbulbifer magnicolonia]|uniref:GNAT family N-acetyltransferase n=1 Tax=Microbulbifer magnicolonia TaxID=3109744 RepID=UPI002B4044B6|nr:GNAT family N-acetyltransferase [Microbulbifer sp. GG15]